MAIRDDFTAGEVLAAADLNDTFAEKIPYAYGTATPTTTVDGYVWFDENSTPPEPKFWDGAAFQAVSALGGLVHIATESFSAVSSVSVNNCFTSTYENYRLVISGTSSVVDTAIRYRLRLSGTDNTTASSYVTQLLYVEDTTVAGSRQTDSLGNICWFDNSLRNIGVADFSGINLATSTGFTSISNNPLGGARIHLVGGSHNQTVAYDGITIFPLSGTFTGTVRVYGYLNS